MRDEDPTSLNDDFVRTFTISSAPKDGEFEITIRNVGAVTRFLFRQNERAGLEVPVLGVGGEFRVEDGGDGEGRAFVAGGVGITPLLGQVGALRLEEGRLRVLWAVRRVDVGLVIDTLEREPGLKGVLEVFFTGSAEEKGEDDKIGKLKTEGVKVAERRLTRADVEKVQAQTWYVCAGKGFREEVQSWLGGMKVVFEDFDF